MTSAQAHSHPTTQVPREAGPQGAFSDTWHCPPPAKTQPLAAAGSWEGSDAGAQLSVNWKRLQFFSMQQSCEFLQLCWSSRQSTGPGGSLGALVPERRILAAGGLKHPRFPQRGWAPLGTQITPSAMLETALWPLQLRWSFHLQASQWPRGSQRKPQVLEGTPSMACPLPYQDPPHLDAHSGPILTLSRTRVRDLSAKFSPPRESLWCSHHLKVFVPLLLHLALRSTVLGLILLTLPDFSPWRLLSCSSWKLLFSVFKSFFLICLWLAFPQNISTPRAGAASVFSLVSKSWEWWMGRQRKSSGSVSRSVVPPDVSPGVGGACSCLPCQDSRTGAGVCTGEIPGNQTIVLTLFHHSSCALAEAWMQCLCCSFLSWGFKRVGDPPWFMSDVTKPNKTDVSAASTPNFLAQIRSCRPWLLF